MFTDKEIRYHNLYFDMAQRIAEMSYAVKLKVGSIIVKDGNVISFGFNGTPAGFNNNCEILDNGNLKTIDEVLHAESNAILKAAKQGSSTDKTSLYTTIAPCMQCAKLIAQAGIKDVFYKFEYKNDLGIQLLEKCNIPVYRI